MVAPEESSTVPVTVPRLVWPWAEAIKAIETSNCRKIRATPQGHKLIRTIVSQNRLLFPHTAKNAAGDNSNDTPRSGALKGTGTMMISGEVAGIDSARGFSVLVPRPATLGNIVSGVFTPVLAKHSSSFSLVDSISVGVDRTQRNFGPLRKHV